MSARLKMVFLLLVLVVPFLANAKSKKKQVLPDYVLMAQTVLAAIQPDAGEPLTKPTANRTAQENVEKALMKWGRFKLVMAAQTADLIFAVRTPAGGPTVRNSPTDNPPVIVEPTGGDIRVGGQKGTPPDLTNPGLGAPNRGPQMGSDVGTSADTLAVYRGGVEYPLDTAPVWQYAAKDALKGPKVTAVEQFQKVLSEAEKQHQQKP